MAAEIKWIKISTNVFADEKIMLIEQMPDADTIIVLWFKLLCMAGRENNCGVFVLGGKIPYTDEMLATIFRRPLATVRLALSTFEAFGMIDIIEDNLGNEVYTIPNWEKHQNVDGMDKIREQNRIRKQRQREREKQALLCDSNVKSRDSHATEEEQEEENEEDKEKEKKKNKNNSAPYVADDALNSAIIEFIDFRKKIKKPMTNKAIELLIKKLNELSPDIVTQIAIINQSILNGWQTVYPLKEDPASKQQPKKNSFNNFNQRQYDYSSLEESLLQSQHAKAIEDP